MLHSFARFVVVISAFIAVSSLFAQSPLQKGMELRYEGEAKVQTAGRALSTKVFVNDLVVGVSENQTVTVASLRVFQPQVEGQQIPQAAALRFLSVTNSGDEEAVPIEQLLSESPPLGFIGQFTTLLPVYFLPTKQLKENNSWTTKERVIIRADLLGEIRYQVVGREKVDGTDCFVVNRTLLKPVILQPEQGAQISKISDRLLVDANSGLVRQIQRETHIQIREGQVVVSQLSLTLKGAQKLDSTAFNQRLEELEAVKEIHKKVGVPVLLKPTKEKLDEAEKALDEFTHRFKNSIYASHIRTWQQLVQLVRQRVEQEEKQTGFIGKEAPDFELTSIDGKKVRLSSFRGKVVVLNFFAHWCGPCNAEAPQLEREFWHTYKDKGVVVIGVAIWAEGDPFERAKEFVQKHNLTYMVLVDGSEKGEVAQLYGVEGVPTNVVIGKDGKIRYLQAGFDPEGMKRAIEEALK